MDVKLHVYLLTYFAHQPNECARLLPSLFQQGDGTYVAGQDFTMADVMVFPLLAFGVRGKLNLSAFPALQDYYLRVEKRPSVKASWPPHWNEEPGKDFFVGI